MPAVESLYINKLSIRLRDPRVEELARKDTEELAALYHHICAALDGESPRDGFFHVNPTPTGGGVMMWISSHPGGSLDLKRLPERADAALEQFFAART